MTDVNIAPPAETIVIIDNKKRLLEKYGNNILNKNYALKVFDTTDISNSLHYNPFMYLNSEEDVLRLSKLLMDVTDIGEDSYSNIEQTLLNALIGYIYYEATPAKRNFGSLIELLAGMETRDYDATFKNAVDLLFEELEGKDPNHFAVKQYNLYRRALSFHATNRCMTRFSGFAFNNMFKLTNDDEILLNSICKQSTVLYILTKPLDYVYCPLINIMLAQFIDFTSDYSSKRLPVQVYMNPEVGVHFPNSVPDFFLLNFTFNIKENNNFESDLIVKFGKGSNVPFDIGDYWKGKAKGKYI